MKLPQISTPDALKAKHSLKGLKVGDLKSLKVSDLKNLKVPNLTSLRVSDVAKLALGRPSGAVVGLDIQPGFVAAVQGRGNGSVVVDKAASMPLAPDTLRHGEVNDEDEPRRGTARSCSARAGCRKRVRVGHRQPAHGAAHARAAPGDRRQGTGGGRELPGPGAGADAAEQRGPRLPPARRDRHAGRARASASCSWPPSATWSNGCLGAIEQRGPDPGRRSTCPPSR